MALRKALQTRRDAPYLRPVLALLLASFMTLGVTLGAAFGVAQPAQAAEGCRSFTEALDKKGVLTSGRSASLWYDCRSLAAGAWRQQCVTYCDTTFPDGPERWSCKGACEAMREMLEKN